MDLLFEYEQLLNVYKYVIVTEPSAFAVATPVEGSIERTAVSDVDQVPPETV